MHDDMRVTRVRVEVEGRTLSDCEQALNLAYSVIFNALAKALEQNVAGTHPELAPALVFPRESVFGEDEYGSRVRTDGAIYYVGRRVISFETEAGMPDLAENLAGVMRTGTILSDDDRVARMELDARVERVGVLRKENGVWAVTVVEDSAVREHEGASLSKALDGAEAALGLLAPSLTLIGLPDGTTVTSSMPIDLLRPLGNATEFDYGDGRRMRFDVLGFPTTVWVDPTVTLKAAAQIACQNVGVVLPRMRLTDGRGTTVHDVEVPVASQGYAEPFQVERP